MNKQLERSSLEEIVHIIPLGYEIDRAVAPFKIRKADRAYILSIPKDSDLDPKMVERQQYFLEKVKQELKKFGVLPEFIPVNMFDVLDVMRVVSSLIRLEKKKGNIVHVNMSSCGRQTSIAVTIAALAQEASVYYVKADGYATGPHSNLENDHGLSIVKKVDIQQLFNFKIKMPKPESVKLLVELFKRKRRGINEMKSDDIFEFFHNEHIEGYEELPEKFKDDYKKGKKRRELLNRTNRGYLNELEELQYIERIWRGRVFYISISSGGEHIACISGLVS